VPAPVPERKPGPAAARQTKRRAFQASFFALFLLAPALDLLRFDLTEAQLWFLGQRWSLGIDAFLRGQATAAEAAMSIMLRGFLPAIVAVAVFIGVAWRYGRLYCGWLCPHFSAVELLNDLLHRACGRFSVWERSATPRAGRKPQARWWPLFALSCVTMGFLWAVTLLTYLLPPAVIWSNLVHDTLTPNQFRFIAIASTVFTLEFAFARHLFCRFGCAAGLFQSLAWMANPKAMVVAFARERARDCKTCDVPRGSACDAVCPMRLHPRNIKRMMFSCVQCGQCLEACEDNQAQPLLEWNVGVDAVRETLRQRKAELKAQAEAAAGAD
jgi:ferredoxin-type protein NapH